jgi:hypothetical protein
MPSGLERALRFWNKNKRNILKCLSSKYINGGGIRQGKGIWKYKIKKIKEGNLIHLAAATFQIDWLLSRTSLEDIAAGLD